MKICYIVLTCEKYLPTRIEWQNSTFFQKVDKKDIFFISCKSSGENVYGWNTEDDYQSCPIKYIKFFMNMEIDYDWYIFIDDDTYMNTTNLTKYLKNYDPTKKYYIGSSRFDKWRVKYMSGGAGFCLSKSLYNSITEYIRSKNNMQELYFNFNGDVTLGSWVNHIPDVLYVHENRFYAQKHKSENQLFEFISFHYLNTKEDFEFYYKKENNNINLNNYLYPRRFKMGRSCGASFEVVTGNLVEESNGVNVKPISRFKMFR
jgi:hypothetical protein